MLLEQIIFIREDVFQAAGLDSCPGLDDLEKGTTLKEFLDVFDENALKKLEAAGEEQRFSLIRGSEMAAMIRLLKEDPQLMQVQFIEKGPDGAYCFEDRPGHAVVAFRGTSNMQDRIDNFVSFWQNDTAAQKTALNYIECLPYEEISVVGHSKGGNKAMYTTLLSDKIDHCLSLDGQGFTPAFLNQYSAEVHLNAHKIHNSSLDHDIVHALLIQPPGSQQSYFQGSEGLSGTDVHSPSAFFHYTQDESGNSAVVQSDGEPILSCSEEGVEIAAFHAYQASILQSISRTAHSAASGILRGALGFAAHLFGRRWFFRPAAGRTPFNAVSYAFLHIRPFADFIAYLMAYIHIEQPTVSQVTSLLSALGLEEMIALFEKAIADFSKIQTIEVRAEIAPLEKPEALIHLIQRVSIRDLMHHPLFPRFMGFSEKWLQETLGVHLDTSRLVKSIEEAYQAIQVTRHHTPVTHGMMSDYRRFDYSYETYLRLKNTIQRIRGLTSGSVDGWNSTYASERWFNDLGISLFVSGIQAYSSRLEAVNQDCLSQIERIFHQVWQIDAKNGDRIRSCRSRMHQVNIKTRKIAGRIG